MVRSSTTFDSVSTALRPFDGILYTTVVYLLCSNCSRIAVITTHRLTSENRLTFGQSRAELSFDVLVVMQVADGQTYVRRRGRASDVIVVT